MHGKLFVSLIWIHSTYPNAEQTITQVTSAVHAKGSFIFLQLWALGRVALLKILHAEDPSFPLVSSSDIPLSDSERGRGSNSGSPGPRPLTIDEIAEYTELYATAAKNAVEEAGFDGVEIHGSSSESKF